MDFLLFFFHSWLILWLLPFCVFRIGRMRRVMARWKGKTAVTKTRDWSPKQTARRTWSMKTRARKNKRQSYTNWGSGRGREGQRFIYILFIFMLLILSEQIMVLQNCIQTKRLLWALPFHCCLPAQTLFSPRPNQLVRRYGHIHSFLLSPPSPPPSTNV